MDEEASHNPCDNFYLEAFDNLKRERQVGMGLGPIPWSAMVLYAQTCNLDGPNTDDFVLVMKVMDDAYLEWHDKQAEQKDKQRSPRGGRNTKPK